MTHKFKISSLTTAIGLAIFSFSAYAADDEKDQEKAKDKDDNKVVIIGSRAAPRSVTDSAVPVDVISADDFKRNGSPDMPTMIQNLVPSFNVNDQPINDAATLVRPANLRGLASDQTLVLVNGKRRHRSAVITFLGGGLSDGAQGPDLSVIPTSAIQAVEVLRDGASAQYGSDAIAGVLNFRLKESSEGGSMELKTGQYFEGDGDTVQVSGNVGLPLTDKGFFNFSYEYKEADATSRSVQRSDAADLIAAGNTDVPQLAQIWGSPEIKEDLKLFFNSGIDLTKDDKYREAYMFANYAEREIEGGFYYRNPHNRGGVNDGGVDANGNQLLLVGDLTDDLSGNCPTNIQVGDNVLTNPDYINNVANNPNCFAFNEILPGGFTPRFGGIVTDMSLVMGTKGDFTHDVSYDISGSIGYSNVEFLISNTINPSLGPDTPSSFSPGQYQQREQTFNFDLTKPIDVEGMDEPIYLAGGFEYRHETFQITAGDTASFEVGPLASQGFGIGSNGFPGFKPQDQGEFSRHNFAFYLDSEIHPNEDWMIGLAVRYEDFSDFGSTTKGKISSRYQLSGGWALRGAYSTGFRAPTVGQSNVRNVTTAFGPNGLEDQATLPPTNPISIQKGATALKPEESKSYSIGLAADLENGFFITLDYFNIEVTDRLSQTSALALSQTDIDALLAQGITDATSFSSVKYFTNDFDTTTQGIDLVASYDMEMLGGETRMSLAANWTDTQVDSFNPDNINAAKVQMLEDNLPAYRVSYTANHSNGNWSILARVNYFGKFFEDHLDAGGDLPIFAGSEITVDSEVGYAFTDQLTFAIGAKNLLDNTPDRNPWDFVVGSKYPTTAPIGINGGFYYARLVYNY
ncbi:MAG: TonB-dependent receptor [Gammaproteobacteria bacterium CG22_combo_CG10-13_8_21_14_all_40_8]|nr:MAG: TonB-dependent receptor [Gammaproteobacteria bacterium CG22_combo_CG10-13_8_21_14_all_40_8]